MLDRLLQFVTGSPAFQFLRGVTPFEFLPDDELERLGCRHLTQLAKRLLAGCVGIDGFLGASEIQVIHAVEPLIESRCGHVSRSKSHRTQEDK